MNQNYSATTGITAAAVGFFEKNKIALLWGVEIALTIVLILLLWYVIHVSYREYKKKISKSRKKATTKRVASKPPSPSPVPSAPKAPPPVDPEKDPRGAFITILKYWIDLLKGFPEMQDVISQINDLIINAGNPLLLIVVGQFNTGKSTFINALLEREILSTDILPETASVTLLKYGKEESIIVHHQNGTVSSRPLGDVKKITSEASVEMKKLRDSIKYVEITLDNDRLKTFSIVDTPGLNSTIAFHSEITSGFVSKGDLVLWLFTVAQPGSFEEIGFLRSLCGDRKPVGILNQIDTLSKDEGDIVEQVKSIRRRLMKDVSGFFPLSSRMALEAMKLKDNNSEASEKLIKNSGWEGMWKSLQNGTLKKQADKKNSLIMQRMENIMVAVETRVNSQKDTLKATQDAINDFSLYKDQIKENIVKLKNLRKNWERVRESKSAIDEVIRMPQFPEMLISSSTLNSKIDSFRGIAERLIEQLDDINGKIQLCQNEVVNHNAKKKDLDRRIYEYNSTNVWGVRSLWDGFKTGVGINNLMQQLNEENAHLNSQAGILNARMKDYQNEGNNWESRRNRCEADCKVFCGEVITGIDETIKDIENKLKHQDQERENLKKKISDISWVIEFEELMNKQLSRTMFPIIGVFAGTGRDRSFSNSMGWKDLKTLVSSLADTGNPENTIRIV